MKVDLKNIDIIELFKNIIPLLFVIAWYLCYAQLLSIDNLYISNSLILVFINILIANMFFLREYKWNPNIDFLVFPLAILFYKNILSIFIFEFLFLKRYGSKNSVLRTAVRASILSYITMNLFLKSSLTYDSFNIDFSNILYVPYFLLTLDFSYFKNRNKFSLLSVIYILFQVSNINNSVFTNSLPFVLIALLVLAFIKLNILLPLLLIVSHEIGFEFAACLLILLIPLDRKNTDLDLSSGNITKFIFYSLTLLIFKILITNIGEDAYKLSLFMFAVFVLLLYLKEYIKRNLGRYDIFYNLSIFVLIYGIIKK